MSAIESERTAWTDTLASMRETVAAATVRADAVETSLLVSRAEVEEMRHPDPIGWTEANRGLILRALFMLMLGNPGLRPGSNVPPETRFKTWWRLVGSSVEHAAEAHAKDTAERVAALVDAPPECPPVTIHFRDPFLSQEEDDDESASLADALAALAATTWPQPNGESNKTGQFQAFQLARALNDHSEYQSDEERERAAVLREFFFPHTPQKPRTYRRRLSRRHLNVTPVSP
jgi:hypothetical protein